MSLPERPVSIAIEEFEFRELPSGGRSFEGYAAVFNSPSEPLPWVETIEPGAFRRSLTHDAGHTFVVDHDDSKLLASRRAATLRLSEDSRGLLVNVTELPNTSYANDLIELHRRGEARAMSFEFWPTRGGAPFNEDRTQRTLRDLKLGHVTVLTGARPAYPATTAAIRSLAHSLHEDGIETLSDALAALHEGRALTGEQADLITRAADSLRDVPKPVPASLVRYRELFAQYALSPEPPLGAEGPPPA